nr:FAD-dependent monooxygenase [Kibdelosporangium sp. MJ126-NF4]ADB02853.1 AzicO7 [Kibdelosporangium sp. MJ126-NF4]CEL14073.1 FAD-binding monooxygenase, PheA/TfdB family, similarity to 2,4-dichlorophenol 6-monooxygenase [Kibdelosporangium sp. MJ126-NF4]CTQ88439.1 Polyketide hydroxylase WhiE VIII [Kibdelosporangium sp. MJ126-NF4]
MPRTQVLVTGGGLTGLSTAVFLAWHGVRCVVVERGPDLPSRPQQRPVNARTMEVLRQVGLEHIVTRHSQAAHGIDASPCPAVTIIQECFESLLRERAEALGVTVCFGSELRSFSQSDEGVTASVTDTDGDYVIDADYLVAADGPHSATRHSLGLLPGDRTCRVGKVFLAGKSANTMPHDSGDIFLQDAHNLAWKLAAVVKGLAGPALLDTYQTERHPDTVPPEAPAEAMTLGFRYQSEAVVDPGDNTPLLPGQLNGQPGSRAPHVPVAFFGRPVSTLDLYGRDFVVLIGSGGTWQHAGEGLPVQAYRIGTHLHSEADLDAAHGITAAGIVLVRPDGFVAWRSPGAMTDATEALAKALRTVLAR